MNLRRSIASVLLVSFTGCMAVQPVSAPEDYITNENPERVRATLVDGSIVVIDSPRVLDERVVGLDGATNDELSVPFANIPQLEARQVSKTRSLLLGLGIAAAVTAALLISSGEDSVPLCFDNPEEACPAGS